VATDHLIIAAVKVHGKGRVQIPKEVRDILNVEDGDRVYFVQDNSGKIFLEKAPALKEKGLGKYDRLR
jgi:AbrB family looped-hinge helix DNA binding protein